MQAGRRYTFFQTVNWTRDKLALFTVWSIVPVGLYYFLGLDWIAIPWQPMSLIGIAVAFYLGFKNNSSYERLWEARKIWGGIVNASRTFTVMTRDFVTNDHSDKKLSPDELRNIHLQIVHRHVAWLKALDLQMRVMKDWEHNSKWDKYFRKSLKIGEFGSGFEITEPYLSADDYSYIQSKGNKASHLLSLQSKQFKDLLGEGYIEDFRHMELANMIKEFYTLQGKSERIKNFPFPRQYATANYFFVVIFIALVPFAMLSIFKNADAGFMIWMSIPFSVLVSWVFWIMEAIGEYSENPFEGLYNDVPITQISQGIEVDIRQMLEETDLPEPMKPSGEHHILY